MSFKCTPEMFAEDVAEHKLTVIRADDIHRHLRFRKPGTYCYGFDIITWPGTLCISGDCGTYVFSRLNDMFEFFRARPALKGDGYINPGYWAEKCDAADKTGGIYEFCQDTFRQAVVERFREYWRDSGNFSSQLAAFRDLRDDVLGAESEEDAYRALHYFDSNGMEFTDCHEMRFRRHTGRFIWNLRAIVWAIAQWDARQAEVEAFRAQLLDLAVTGMPRSFQAIVEDLRAGGYIHKDAVIEIDDVPERGLTRVAAPHVYMKLLKRHIERERRIGHAVEYIEMERTRG